MDPGVPQAMIETPTSLGDWVIVLPLVLPLMGGALLLMLRRVPGAAAWLALAVIAAVIACEAALLARVLESGPVAMTMGRWLPPFGISFAADIFGAGFALASAVASFVVLVYMQAEPAVEGNGAAAVDRAALVLLLLAGVTGAFLTGDFFNLYVWFEVMLIASFGLLVLGGRSLQMDGAVKYGFLNFLATTLFLLALGLTYGLLGTLNMADIALRSGEAEPTALAGVAALLVLAFGMKAAAFPVNAWLPASYHTPPAAVSALFAGLLTKVGVYALLRALTVLFPTSLGVVGPVLAAMAAATLVIAPLGAIAETNLRRAIGFLVIGGIGAVLAGLAMPGTGGIAGAGFYILNAILTMTALYLVAGLVEALTGETDSRRMGGVYAAHSGLSVLFLITVLAAAGVPPLLGFWPKLLLVEAGLGMEGATGVVLVAALLVNAVLTLIAGTRLWAHIFWRAGPEGALSEHGSGALAGLGARQGMLGLGASAVLVAGIVALGLAPGFAFEAVLAGAADIADPARYIAAFGLAGAEAAP